MSASIYYSVSQPKLMWHTAVKKRAYHFSNSAQMTQLCTIRVTLIRFGLT
jgi:hypothetical protein